MKDDTSLSERTRSQQVKGFFRAHGQLIRGWVLDQGDTDRKLDVEILVDGHSVGVARADRYDASVQAQYGGHGLHGFAFYVPRPLSGWVTAEAVVRETRSRQELRSKHPKIVAASDTGTAELHVEEVNPAKLTGRAEGYPRIALATLEFWSGDERVLSDIPIKWDERQKQQFSAELPGEAIRWLFAVGTRVALPGLEEAGLAASLPEVRASVTRIDDDLLVDFSTDADLHAAAELAVELTHDGGTIGVAPRLKTGKSAVCIWPTGLPASATVQVYLHGCAVPTSFERELNLSDLNFITLSDADQRAWQLSEGCSGERGFYAFPPEMASELGLSGHFAHLWREVPGEAIGISQPLQQPLAIHEKVTKRALLRARSGTRLVMRLTDDAGVIAETATTAKGAHRWVPLNLEAEISRAVEGVVRFEIESQADGNDELEIALCKGVEAPRHAEPEEARNLLINDGLVKWPAGAGVQLHTVRGEVCEGWRLFNRRCGTPVLSRATMHVADDSIGLAIAAPEVSHYLRLEADLSGNELEEREATLHFRASVSSAARRLMSQSTAPVAAFTVIDRIYLLRRTRRLIGEEFIEKDEVLSTVARRISIGWDDGKHRFVIPSCGRLEPEEWESGEVRAQHTYHLIFEFRSSAVIELSEVVIAAGVEAYHSEPERLNLEDRNIELQVPLLKSLEQWISATPALPGTRPQPAPPALKWSASGEVVEIVVPVHNALEETMGCLESLSRTTTRPILVRLIDDGSDADVAQALDVYAADKPWVHVHHFDANRGYTLAADFGMRAAQSEWVVLLNSDTVTTEGWLEGMLACAQSDPKIAFVGPLSNAATYQSVPHVYDADGKFKVNALPGGHSPESIATIVRRVSRRDYPDAPLLNGFCTLMKRSVFVEVGGLNHGAFPHGYGEENDLCLRVRKAGWRLVIADDVYVFHHKSASFGNARRKQLSKAGGAALKRLHPDVDIEALTRSFRELPALNAVRGALARELEGVVTGAFGEPTSEREAVRQPTHVIQHLAA